MIALLFAAFITLTAYDASVVRVVDGDTVNVRIAIWIDQELSASIRVRGIDTPELKGQCVSERALAQMALAHAGYLLPAGARVVLSNVGADKFGGRYDADLRVPDGRMLAAVMIEAGLARAYKGGKRAGWCDGH